MKLTRERPIYVLTLTNGAESNTLTEDVVGEYHDLLDELEASKENCALVVTSSDPKFWSNGINLNWLLKQPPRLFSEVC
jgi:enoyl-CoA hydratase/carnithine racemase